MHQPLTHAPIGRALLRFSLPLWGGYVLQSLNTSVNAFWIGHYLGEAALSAAVHANNLLFVLIALVFGISQASNLLVAQAVGAGRWALARRITGSSASLFRQRSFFSRICRMRAMSSAIFSFPET